MPNYATLLMKGKFLLTLLAGLNSCIVTYRIIKQSTHKYKTPTNAIIGVRHSSLTLQEYLTFLSIGLGIPSFDMLCARKSYGGILKKVIFSKMSVTGVLFRDVDIDL